ncbi:MAG TPA: NAD(P)/FAD-dependent oxidoreductase [bacterium]|nr:NAD(P)/FAD-dependent oxidoreductase [bacterium]
MVHCDVVVVGAGPGGAEAARAAAAQGLRTLLLEEHRTVGLPTHCTGKLSRHAFREFDLPPSLAVNTLSAAVFHSPSGFAVRVRRPSADSYVVDRVVFDRWLVARAARAGAEVMTGVRITHVAPEAGGGLRVRGEYVGAAGAAPFEAATRVVIDAEGAAPRLPALVGLRPARTYAHGLQYEMRGLGGLEPDTPEMFFGRDIAPGFFAWLLPLGGGRARVGVAVDPAETPHAPVRYLERLLAAHPAVRRRAAGAAIVRKVGGRIPMLSGRTPAARHGMLVVGDAAGQVKATSGGGIYFAMLAGRLAGRAAARYAAGDRGAARLYEHGWRRAFGREVAFTALGRRVLNRLADRELDVVMRVIHASPAVRASVEADGDTQYQSKIFVPLLRSLAAASLRRPALLPLVGQALVQGMLVQM